MNHKYAYEFRFPKRWGDKITLTDYHTLMGEFGARSIRAAMSIIDVPKLHRLYTHETA